MAIRNDLSGLLHHINSFKDYRKTNFTLIDIYNGNLWPYIKDHLFKVLSNEQAEEATKFIVSINVLQKIIDKLSKIYQQKVSRRVAEGSDSDSELLVWYEESFRINQIMNLANEMFNLTKTALVEPYIEDGIPRLRVIPNDRFVPYSDSLHNPTKMTHLNIILKEEKLKDRTRMIYATWTDDEVLIWDDEENVRTDLMQVYLDGDISGVNPYEKIPYVYINQSSSLLIPKHDTDVLNLTLEIPNQLSYLNYGVGYNAFPITYGIDIDDEGLTRAPNAFWNIKSDPDSDKTPVVDTIKPVIDISETLNFIQSELAFWLNTKGIRPGSVGDMGAENFTSGISKIVDEMDTFEARKKQIDYFKNAEENLWNLMFNHVHPVWSARGLIENRAVLTPTASIDVEFIEPKPMETRGDLVDNLKAEMDAGFISRKRAIKKLNPELSDKEIEELILEIDTESTIEMPTEEPPAEDKENDEDEEGDDDKPAA